MSTHGRIGIELRDGSVLSIYSHWNNFPEHNGRILRTHYNTREKVEELIDLGDCSSIWTDSVWGQPRTDGKKYGPEPYSARGEDCPSLLAADLCEFLLPDGCEEYHYIFTRNNQWVCYNMHQFDDTKLPEVVEIPSGALAV
jgi:hypothetical protein